MYIIEKEFFFSAAHKLLGLPEEHPCSRLHGHNYTVIVSLMSLKTNKTGFVEDYRSLEDIKKWIDKTFDHRYLNDVVDYNPTAENLAKDLFLTFKEMHPMLQSVRVKETFKTEAIYFSSKEDEENEEY